VDRSSLESLLQQGVSLAEIGRRFGRHESTVAYWLQRHGLRAVNREKHAPKGRLERAELEAMVGAGRSVAEIARAVQRSKPTVRHWLRCYGLKTHGVFGRRMAQPRALARTAGLEVAVLRCERHGETEFALDKRGYYRCKRCNSQAVARRRRAMKQILVEEAGGACTVCGYERNVRALHFHHLQPAEKRHEISARGAAMALKRLQTEARKCVLLCANCHAELEAGLIVLTEAQCAPYNGRHPPLFRGSSNPG
jgi:transposase-like protein